MFTQTPKSGQSTHPEFFFSRSRMTRNDKKKNDCCQLNVLDKEESKLTNPVFEEKLKNNLTTQFGHLQNLYPIRDGFTRD